MKKSLQQLFEESVDRDTVHIVSRMSMREVEAFLSFFSDAPTKLRRAALGRLAQLEACDDFGRNRMTPLPGIEGHLDAKTL